MKKFHSIVQINNVWPGPIGGAVFTAKPLDSVKNLLFKISRRTLERYPKEGEFWKIKGNKSFNKQKLMWEVNVENCTVTNIPSPRFLPHFLKKHLSFRGFGLGPKKINAIIDGANDNFLFLNWLNLGKWEEIARFVNKHLAIELCKRWKDVGNEVQVSIFLSEHGFEQSLLRKLMFVYGDLTLNKIIENPYRLVAFVEPSSINFSKIDACAKSLVVKRFDFKRLVGASEFWLYKRLKAGHTAILECQFIEEMSLFLRSKSKAKLALTYALEDKAICQINIGKEVYCQPVIPAFLETCVENEIKQLLPKEQYETEKLKQEIHHSILNYLSNTDISYSEEQVKAIQMVFSNNCSIIKGYAGTGKTTVLKAIADIAKSLKRDVYMMTLAGKAKERIREVTNHNASTIHNFIRLVKSSSYSISFENNPLIIIDEASMVDLSLFYELIKVLRGKNYSLLTVGDELQLSPVGFGVVWHKMLISKIPSVELTIIKRQSDMSQLQKLSLLIRNGHSQKLKRWNGEIEGVFFVESDSRNHRNTIFSLKKQLPKAVILSPHQSEKKVDSIKAINNELQYGLNCDQTITGYSDDRGSLNLGGVTIKENDPVIITQNNYRLSLFNGVRGTLLSINYINGEPVGNFEFEGREISTSLSINDCLDLGIELAYAITIHKSQGSEFEQVIVSCISKSDFIERSLIYTALTRSQKLCIFIGKENVFHEAVKSVKRVDKLDTALSFI